MNTPNSSSQDYKSMMWREVISGFFKAKTHLDDDIIFKSDEKIATIPAPTPEHLRAYRRAVSCYIRHNGFQAFLYFKQKRFFNSIANRLRGK